MSYSALSDAEVKGKFRSNHIDIVNKLTKQGTCQIASRLLGLDLLTAAEKEKICLDVNTATESAQHLVGFVLKKDEIRPYRVIIDILENDLNQKDLLTNMFGGGIQGPRDRISLADRVIRNRAKLIDGLRKISIQQITVQLRGYVTRNGKVLITKAEENAIMAKCTDEDMARELLDVVSNHGEEAVLQLISSLRSEQVGKDELADLLEDPCNP